MIRRFANRYFVGWLLVALPAFLVAVAVVEVASQVLSLERQAVIPIAVGVGLVLDDLLEPVLEAFVESHSEQLDEDAAGGGSA